ncbi:hypothetical protein [Symbiopectobacterium sp. RP]|uniref:hypothetical protein n=1 Tax=Symbiopectobacterium sp. RP TaxID=3248553 RepID=UPI003D29CD68
MITANALICGKKIQLIVIKIMSLGYTVCCLCDYAAEAGNATACAVAPSIE